jgi:hypothetical protein
MEKRNYLKISKTEMQLRAMIKFLQSKKVWSSDDLLLFTDLRQACNLFDFEMEEQCSKLSTYND